MNKRRSHLEIQVAILDSISRGDERPTQIMFTANLSWLILQKTLHTLESSGLISKSYQKNRFIYSLTEKGYSVLKGYMDVKKTLES